FRAAPRIGMPKSAYMYDPTILLYDQTNLRFVQLTSNLRGVRLPTAPETAFSFNTGRKFVYMNAGLQDGGVTFAILEDPVTGKYWLYGMRAQGSFALSQLPAYYHQLDAPQIEQATAFAIHPTLWHLFYAVGDTVYQYDMVTRTCRALPFVLGEGEAEVSRLAGEQITMLKFNVFGLDVYSKPAGSAAMQYRLIVGSHSPDAELSGNVRMFDIATATDRPATLFRSYSGLGRVVDVTYKETR
ncbi:MAG: hypothetical protein FWG22_02415, partial [Prolixibacteraceae bacterium]|nr:hypothetical protein [Prolixibacteraceae bacterium]